MTTLRREKLKKDTKIWKMQQVFLELTGPSPTKTPRFWRLFGATSGRSQRVKARE
jgi:hypothetical protein